MGLKEGLKHIRNEAIPDTPTAGTIADFVKAGGFGSGFVRKEITFLNTNADVTILTVTGKVLIRLFAVCTTNCASAGGCNINVGCIIATDVIVDTDVTLLAAGEIWHDATPDTPMEDMSVVKEKIIGDGNDIVLHVQLGKQVDSGAIEFYCFWTGLNSTGNVVAA